MGLAAFSLVLPITYVVLGVLILVTLSYREVVMVYTKAGGSYVVSRDNFGVRVAQIAAVALLIDYTVTVAVQTAAGTNALTSAVPSLVRFQVPITVGVVVVMLYLNLRGLREAGRLFAIPAYLFIFSTGVVIIGGLLREAISGLPTANVHAPGALPLGTHKGSGFLMGATVFIMLKAFANGGSSLTGLEAISNGVGTFRPPEGINARRVLVIMSTILGCLVFGVSWLAHKTHAIPFVNGSPTVLSQEAKLVFGSSAAGHAGFLFVQFAHRRHSVHRWQYQLQRLSLPGQFCRRGPVPAGQADQARPSAGVLRRHSCPDHRLRRAVTYHPGPGERPGGRLCHRRLYRIHDGRRRDGQAPPDA